MVGHDAPAVIDPSQRQKFVVLLNQGFGTQQKLVLSNVFVGHISGQSHDLLLALQQTQAQSLLRVFHIYFDGFLLALHFFHAQIPKCRSNGRQKQDHCRHGGQVGKTVLSVG